jgi:hypothetical protein
MTQYFRDFKSDPVGLMPIGWSEVSPSGTFQVTDAGVGIGKVLAYTRISGVGGNYVWWSGADGPGLFLNGDLLVKCFDANPVVHDIAEAMCRMPTSVTSINNQIMSAATPSLTRLRVARHEGYSSIATGVISLNTSIAYYIRFNFNGTSFKAKIWGADIEEPLIWNIELVYTLGALLSGHVGSQIYSGDNNLFLWYSVSDDPLVAAFNPDGGQTSIPTPINLGGVNIQGNSFRATWEQGV